MTTWKLVPTTITVEMTQAADTAAFSNRNPHERLSEVWAAMLNAAPAPDVQPVVWDGLAGVGGFRMTRDDVLRMANEVWMAGDMYIGPHAQNLERFAALVAAHEREACINIIERYRIPVGNSSAGELACEWTCDALKEIRDDIRTRSEK